MYPLKKIVVPIFVSSLLLTACNDSGDSGESPEQAALNMNRATWNSGAFTNYVFTYSRVCFCAPEEEIIVTVTDSVITDAFYTPSGTQVSIERMASLFTIDELFDLIQESITMPVDRLEVSYNPTFGYPEQIFIDQELGLADEEMTHNVSNFQ